MIWSYRLYPLVFLSCNSFYSATCPIVRCVMMFIELRPIIKLSKWFLKQMSGANEAPALAVSEESNKQSASHLIDFSFSSSDCLSLYRHNLPPLVGNKAIPLHTVIIKSSQEKLLFATVEETSESSQTNLQVLWRTICDKLVLQRALRCFLRIHRELRKSKGSLSNSLIANVEEALNGSLRNSGDLPRTCRLGVLLGLQTSR